MTRSPRLPWRTALVAVALIAGLLALHALSHHGEQLPSTSATGTHPGHDSGHHEEPTPADSHDGALTLCLAMLAGAAALLLATAVRRRGSRPLLTLPRGAARAVPLLAGRAHAPPDRWALSVCRC